MKFLLQTPLAFILLMVGVSLAEAHAFPDHSDPAVGATVHVSPAMVKIWFTRKIKSGPSTLQVFDFKRQEVDRRDVRVDANDPTLMCVSVPKLAAGAYQVIWQAVCLDGHTTHGSFTFEMAAP